MLRHNWTFAGSDEGGRRAAAIYTLVETKLNDIDPQASLPDVLARLQDHPAKRHRQTVALELEARSRATSRRLIPGNHSVRRAVNDHLRGLRRIRP